MLARAGVGKLRLVDFDQVTLSSLNRHAVATRADVGLSKAAVLRSHMLRTVPHCDIDARNVMFTADAADELLAGASARHPRARRGRTLTRSPAQAGAATSRSRRCLSSTASMI